MKLSNLKNNFSEVLNADNLLSVKGGDRRISPFNGGGTTINSTDGNETDKRIKRPGTFFSTINVLNQAK